MSEFHRPSHPEPPPSRHLFKRLAIACIMPQAACHLAAHALRSRVVGPEQALSITSEYLARVPGLRGVYLRSIVLRRLCGHVGQDVYVGYQTLVSKPGLELGDRAYVGRYCTLGDVRIASDVKIADGVQVLSGGRQHDASDAGYQTVHIGERAWIGANAVVMANIGADAVVGAGAVVTRPVPAGVTVAGVPARPIHSPTTQRIAA